MIVNKTNHNVRIESSPASAAYARDTLKLCPNDSIILNSQLSGQMSFEERMGCGFGACMGCSCKTLTGYKRICKDGPVMKKEEILWEA